MPSVSKSRRVASRKVAPKLASEKSRRKVRKASPKPPVRETADALLIAQFAEALGQTPARPRGVKGRSLADALRASASADDVIDVMLGARVAVPIEFRGLDDVLPVAPCVAVHRRHRLHARVKHASSHCFAVVVSAGIIAATALGIVSFAPQQPHATLAFSEAAKAPAL